jgi:hypothetical protein
MEEPFLSLVVLCGGFVVVVVVPHLYYLDKTKKTRSKRKKTRTLIGRFPPLPPERNPAKNKRSDHKPGMDEPRHIIFLIFFKYCIPLVAASSL